MDARSIHKRGASTVGAAKAPASSKKAAAKNGSEVPIKVRPEEAYQDKETFAEFYPLHVTKVEPATPKSWVGVVVGIVIVVAAAAGAVWYVAHQESQNTTSTTSSSTPLEVTPTPTTTASTVGAVVDTTTIGIKAYQNTTYHFSMTLPASWAAVVPSLVAGEASAQAVKPQDLIHLSIADAAGNPVSILTLRVDTAASYAQWVASLPAGSTVPQKLNDASTYVISVFAKATPTTSTDPGVQKAVTDLPTLLASYKAI